LGKRISIEKNEYDYIHIPIKQFEAAIEDQNRELNSGYRRQMILEKAPLWYCWYRASKPRFNKLAIIIITAILTTIITLLLTHFFGDKKK